MHKPLDPQSRQMAETLAGRALLVLFGLGVLGFLVAIDRAEWFAIRPATGTSIAMAQASSSVTSSGIAAKSDYESSTSHP